MAELTIQEYAAVKKAIQQEIAAFTQAKLADFYHETGIEPKAIYICTEQVQAFGLPTNLVVTGAQIETDI